MSKTGSRSCTPVSHSPPLERAFMPDADKVVDAVRTLVRY